MYVIDNLPTARQKKRKARKDFDRRLLALDREYSKVRKQIYNLGYEDLEVPYQRGWKRSFALRDDVRQSPQATFFESILEKINTVQYSTRKDFKKKRRRRGKSGYVVRPQELQKPDFYEPVPCRKRIAPAVWIGHEFRRLKFTGEEVHLFQPEEYWCPYGKCWRTRYVFREPWRFVLKIEPNMVTQRKKVDRELECYKAELEDVLYACPARPRLNWLRGYKRYREWGYAENVRLPKNPFKNRQKNQVCRELFEIEHIPENISFELFYEFIH